MRRVVLAGLIAAFAAPSAQAAWSPVVRIPNSGTADVRAIALDARGDAAVVWTRAADDDLQSLRVAVRRGRAGRFVTTTLLRPSARAVQGPTITIDARGETTVAWVERASNRGLLHGTIRVRAAFRSASGHWSGVRTVAAISPFAYAFPHLAAAPDRRVLLTFNAGNRRAPGMAAAWRRPGHGFGSVQDLNTGPRGAGYLYDTQTQFDRSGRAYVSGTRDCNMTSAGVLLTAAPGATRFTSARIVAPPPVRDLHLAVTGSGRGVLAWLRANCSTTESSGGALQVATVHASAAGPPALVSDAAFAVGLVAGPAGTAEARWLSGPLPSAPNGVAQVARSDAAGAFGAPFTPADGLVGVVADARGDQLVGVADPNRLSVGGQPVDLRARTPDGTLTSPPPPADGADIGGAAAPIGSGLAVAVGGPGGVRFSSWTP